jgi:uncharacterized membrane protein (Fun14 family)
VNGTNFSYVEQCGANCCPATNLLESATQPSFSSAQTLLITLASLLVGAMIITGLFVDNIPNITVDNEEKKSLTDQQLKIGKLFFNSIIYKDLI